MFADGVDPERNTGKHILIIFGDRIDELVQRENVLFGQAFDEDKYWRAIELACLLPGLQFFPDGDITEVTRRYSSEGRLIDLQYRSVREGST